MEDVTEVKRNRIESAEKSGEDDANEVFGSVLAALQNGSQDIKQEYGVSGNSSDGGVSNSSNVNEGEEEDYVGANAVIHETSENRRRMLRSI
uniref:Uncharacterized protein n=1 Tax=Caenorhabditis japonica TaxID=281687 RepID=A0A8R1I5H9_CAEJA